MRWCSCRTAGVEEGPPGGGLGQRGDDLLGAAAGGVVEGVGALPVVPGEDVIVEDTHRGDVLGPLRAVVAGWWVHDLAVGGNRDRPGGTRGRAGRVQWCRGVVVLLDPAVAAQILGRAEQQVSHR